MYKYQASTTAGSPGILKRSRQVTARQPWQNKRVSNSYEGRAWRTENYERGISKASGGASFKEAESGATVLAYWKQIGVAFR